MVDANATTTCPYCKGRLLVEGRRAWCLAYYRDGGCGSYFYEEPGGWMRQSRLSNSVWGDRRPDTSAPNGPFDFGESR